MFDKDLVLPSAIRAAVVNMMTNPAFVNSLSYHELAAIKRTVDHLTPPETVSDQLNAIQSPEGQVEFLRQRFGDGNQIPGVLGITSLGYPEPFEPGDLAKAIADDASVPPYPLELRSDGNYHFVIADEMIRQQALYMVMQEMVVRGIQDSYRIGDQFSFYVPSCDPQARLQMINSTTGRKFSFETTLDGFHNWLKKAKELKEAHMEQQNNG